MLTISNLNVEARVEERARPREQLNRLGEQSPAVYAHRRETPTETRDAKLKNLH